MRRVCELFDACQEAELSCIRGYASLCRLCRYLGVVTWGPLFTSTPAVGAPGWQAPGWQAPGWRSLRCTIFALVGMVVWAPPSTAQLPTNELRLWLKADSLNLAEDAPVAQWVDSSPHGTIFAPRTSSNPAGPLGGASVEERPHLRTVVVNGKSFPTVQFERSGDISNAGNPKLIDRGPSIDFFRPPTWRPARIRWLLATAQAWRPLPC